MKESLLSTGLDAGDLQALDVRLDNLLELSGDGLLYVDRNLVLCSCNQAAMQMLGPRASNFGLSLEDPACGLPGRAFIAAAARQVLAGRQRMEIGPIDSGSHRLMVTALPIHNSGPDIEGALLFFRDVTESEQLKQRFEFAIEAAFMNWWEWNIVADRVEVSTGKHSLLGIEPQHLPTDRQGWMTMVHPDDRQYVEHNLDACLAGETDLWFCECRLVTRDGGWIWVDNRGTVSRRDEEGRPLEMMGTSQDIDATKRAHLDMRSKNDALEKAGEIVQLGTWEYCAETNSVTWSKVTRQILGVDDQFEACAQAFYEMIHPDDLDTIQAAFNEALEKGTDYNLRIRCRNNQGKDIVVRSACKTRQDLFGKTIRVSGIFQDITNEKGVDPHNL